MGTMALPRPPAPMTRTRAAPSRRCALAEAGQHELTAVTGDALGLQRGARFDERDHVAIVRVEFCPATDGFHDTKFDFRLAS